MNSGPRPCLVDVGFPLSGPRVRTSTSDLKRHTWHTAPETPASQQPSSGLVFNRQNWPTFQAALTARVLLGAPR